MKQWNEEVFAIHNRTGSNIPIGTANRVLTVDEQIEEEIQRAMEGLKAMNSDTDDDDESPQSSQFSASTVPPNSITPPDPLTLDAPGPSDEEYDIYDNDPAPATATVSIALSAPILVRDIYQSHLISTF